MCAIYYLLTLRHARIHVYMYRYGFNTMVADRTVQLLFAVPLVALSFFVLL
jgi:hypothetical protein